MHGHCVGRQESELNKIQRQVGGGLCSYQVGEFSFSYVAAHHSLLWKGRIILVKLKSTGIKGSSSLSSSIIIVD